MKHMETRDLLAICYSAFGALYIVGTTFISIPVNNHRVVDTVLGFVLGTIISTIIGFYFGSSKGSADKNSMIKNKD
jgi:hypothetical protein